MKPVTFNKINLKSAPYVRAMVIFGLLQILTTVGYLGSDLVPQVQFIILTLLFVGFWGLIIARSLNRITIDEKGIRNNKLHFTWEQVNHFLVINIERYQKMDILSESTLNNPNNTLAGLKIICVTDMENYNPRIRSERNKGIVFQFRQDAYEILREKARMKIY